MLPLDEKCDGFARGRGERPVCPQVLSRFCPQVFVPRFSVPRFSSPGFCPQVLRLSPGFLSVPNFLSPSFHCPRGMRISLRFFSLTSVLAMIHFACIFLPYRLAISQLLLLA